MIESQPSSLIESSRSYQLHQELKSLSLSYYVAVLYHGLGMRCGLGNMLFSKTYYVSYERFDGEIPQSKALTRDIVWMLLRRSWYEPWISSTQVDLP